MPDGFLLLVPLALLAIFALVRFVGCSFDAVQAVSSPDLVSEWSLGESAGPTANDAAGENDGAYRTITLPADPDEQSPATASPAVLQFAAPGLLDAEPAETSVEVDGGYVEVPFSESLNTGAFTILAWAHPEWNAGETVDGSKPFRCVMASREIDGAGRHGYALYAGPPDPADATRDPSKFYWQIWVGTGAGDWQKLYGPEVEADQTTFLTVTFDGTTLKLYVNGSNDTEGTPDAQRPVPGYSPNPGKPLYIGMGAPERVPPQQMPLFPFKGRLQEIKAYKAALPPTTIDNHFMARQLTGG